MTVDELIKELTITDGDRIDDFVLRAESPREKTLVAAVHIDILEGIVTLELAGAPELGLDRRAGDALDL